MFRMHSLVTTSQAVNHVAIPGLGLEEERQPERVEEDFLEEVTPEQSTEE